MLATIKKLGSVVVIVGVGLLGCAKSTDEAAPDAPAGQVSEAGHALHGWWCTEHGVPEDECALCSAKVAADLKAKGDWCDEHDRPDSQCFVCHPEREAEFAALYEAKYGEAPPKPHASEGHEHEAEHDDHGTES
jgi:cobalt-zinc-cadmium efflux system membrane fusion protein